MPESIIPGTIGRLMGGGTKPLDQTLTRAEKDLANFAAGLEKMLGTITKFNAGRTGGMGGGTVTSQSAQPTANGGGFTFGGSSGGAHRPDSHRAEGGAQWGPSGGWAGTPIGGDVSFGGSGGGAHVGGPTPGPPSHRGSPSSGGGSTAKKVLGVAAVGVAAYTAKSQDSMTLGQSVAAEYAYNNDDMASYRAMMTHNYSAMNSADAAQGAATLANGGFYAQSAQYSTERKAVMGIALGNPGQSQASIATATNALAGPAGFNGMRKMGINTMGGPGGTTDPRQIALQVLQKMGNYRAIKTPEDISAAIGPSGPVQVTLQNWVASGVMPAEAMQAVRGAIINILQAQIGGVSAQKVWALQDQYQSGSNSERTDAYNQLKKLGMANSLVQKQKDASGVQRDTEAATISSFTSAVKTSSGALQKFHGLLNSILSNTPAGTALGASSGVMSSGVGGFLKKVTGGLMMAGGLALAPETGGLGLGLTVAGAGMMGGSAPTMSRGSGGRSRGAGGGTGGQSQNTQSTGGGGGGAKASSGGGGAGGSAGVSFIAPRPGMDSMSSEQDFGPRTIGQGFHTGIDLEGGVGAPIKASAAGAVIGAGWGSSGDSGYGNTVMIDHGGGFVTMYAHMSSFKVSRGDSVRQGQIIGSVGDTGSYSQGAHLHFELHINGKPVDPVPYLSGRRANIKSVPGGSGSSGQGKGQAGSGADMGVSGAYNNGDRYGSSNEASALGLGAGASVLVSSTGSSGTQQSSSAGTSSPGGSGKGSGKGATTSGGHYKAGAGVEQWRDEVVSAMGQLGVKSPSQAVVDRVMMQMKSESGGNPTVVNKWDSNWTAGHPSVGLMQVIKGTFAANAGPYKNTGPFSYGVSTDPMANIYAALHYARERYGSWENAFHGVGYAKGAWELDKDQIAKVHKKEMILPADMAEAVRGELQARGSRSGLKRGGGGVTLQFQPGSITVSMGGTSGRDAHAVGRQIVDAIVEDNRLVALQEGRG